jgi:GlpG protein
MRGDGPLRQIGTVPKRLDVKVFADYLLTLGMKTRVDEAADGWIVWIYHEDHFPRAREELQAYVNGPDDPRYQNAVDAAEEIRRKQRELDQQFRKNYREVATMWASPGLRRRPLTTALVSVCVVVFVLQESSKGLSLKQRLWFAPIYVSATGGLKDGGFNEILHGELWRLVTPIFMHGSILHIFFNMWWLSSLGTMIEGRRGALRLAGLVLIAAILSNVGQYIWMERMDPGEPHTFEGMSGVVYALLGYIWMKGLYEPEQGMIIHPNTVNFMLLWLVLCMTGVVGPIANAAHFVGLMVGVALGVLRF